MKGKIQDSSLKIRALEIADLAELNNLVSDGWPGQELGISACEQFASEIESASIENVRLVALINGRVVGTLGCNQGGIPSPNALWIDWLVVHKDYRRSRVASILYHCVEQHALKLRKNYVCLDIGNIDAEKAAFLFHTKNGFQVVGQIPNYWGDALHMNIMCKNIAGNGGVE
jgi:GNAT superfamily N-acetyltransferase